MPHALVIVPVSEVEPYVASLRERFDRSARRGLGAHVTLLHVPLSPHGVDAAMCTMIAETAARVAPFRYAVTGLAQFPGTIYLAVDPQEPFNELHARLASPLASADAVIPGAAGRKPPREFIPHISVVRAPRRAGRGPADADAAVDALPVAEAELIPLLDAAPLRCECREIVLLEDSTGRWQPVQAFALSGCTGSPSPAPS